MLYQALTGRLPFQGEHQLLVMNAIQHEQPKPVGDLRPGTPDDLQRIVARALEKTRETRYASAGEVAADLLACRAARTAATIVSPAPRRRGWSSATLVGVLVSAAVVLAVGVTVLLRARPKAVASGPRNSSRKPSGSRTAESSQQRLLWPASWNA